MYFDHMTKRSLKATFKNYLNSSQKLYTEYIKQPSISLAGSKDLQKETICGSQVKIQTQHTKFNQF